MFWYCATVVLTGAIAGTATSGLAAGVAGAGATVGDSTAVLPEGVTTAESGAKAPSRVGAAMSVPGAAAGDEPLEAVAVREDGAGVGAVLRGLGAVTVPGAGALAGMPTGPGTGAVTAGAGAGAGTPVNKPASMISLMSTHGKSNMRQVCH